MIAGAIRTSALASLASGRAKQQSASPMLERPSVYPEKYRVVWLGFGTSSA
jgi:hypothetical protein